MNQVGEQGTNPMDQVLDLSYQGLSSKRKQKNLLQNGLDKRKQSE